MSEDQGSLSGTSVVRSVMVLLVLAVVVSIVLLVTDDFLWRAAVQHAYAVVAFIVVDLVLLALLALRTRTGLKAVSVWSLLQTVGMVTDPLAALVPNPLTGETFFGGLTVAEAARYLFLEQAYFTFDILLGIKVLLLVLSYRTLRH